MKFLKFKSVNTFCLLLLLLLLIARFYIIIPYGTFLFIGFIWLVLTIVGSFNILWNYHFPLLSFNPNCKGKKIALTFDDGPNPTYTPQVLELLRSHQIKATFFCIGKNIAKHPELLKKIVAEGHTIGNHSYSHSNFLGFYSKKKIVEELNKTNTLVRELTGQEMKLFRPPFGVTNPSIKKGLLVSKHTSIGWNIRSLDTVIKEKKKIFRRIIRKLKPGAIILFHDTSQRTVEVLKDLLVFLDRQQFQAVSVEELLNIKAYD